MLKEEKRYKDTIKVICPKCKVVTQINELLFWRAYKKNGFPCPSCLIKRSEDINLILTSFEVDRIIERIK